MYTFLIGLSIYIFGAILLRRISLDAVWEKLNFDHFDLDRIKITKYVYKVQIYPQGKLVPSE